jgi:arginyl-tRNA synthetase
MSIVQEIKQKAVESIFALFDFQLTLNDVAINETKPEFEGDYTIVTFGFAKQTGKKPDDIAEQLGAYLITNHQNLFASFNVIKGFLNLVIQPDYFIQFLNQHYQNKTFGNSTSNGKKVMIEYSSPNTNKPLHFGHLRNIFLGASVAEIGKASGNEIIKANLINDRGIHICKSMIAWMKYGDETTPEKAGIKGDHLVGDYYVKFNDVYKSEIETLLNKGTTKEEAEKQAPIMLEAQLLLRKWEAGDQATLQLWKKMNDWVYDGFYKTYNRLGISFDKMYYESDTYLLGKKIVDQGLSKGVFFKKDDQSVWIDLTHEGLDEKLLLRGDGTSVYITQDVGTAQLKYEDFGMDESVYVIGDEQNYHVQVLKLILQKMGEPYANGIHHLSYGMVELPHGKMKSREGNVVDADDMIDEMIAMAKKNTEALGKVDDFAQNELFALYNTLGLGALKFYLLRVDPKKRMIFNPEESIDFQGFTGPFVQYTHARICSILRKAGDIDFSFIYEVQISSVEKKLLKTLESYPSLVLQASLEYNPSIICNFIFHVAKEFNSFLVDHSILKADTDSEKLTRLKICHLSKHIIAHGLNLLGIFAPNRM